MGALDQTGGQLASYSNKAGSYNVRWGYDNRTCGIRVPQSTPANRRVENRVPGVDVNPYLAIAATLAYGYQAQLAARTQIHIYHDQACHEIFGGLCGLRV